MTVMNQILQLATKNNGFITSAEISRNGISRGNLKYLADNNILERTSRGVYVLPEIWEDEFFDLQSRFRKGIYSCETALFLWDLTDITPNQYCMTFPKTYNLTNVKKERIRCYNVKNEWYDIGISTVSSPSGNTIKAYNMERTICDIMQKRKRIDTGIITEAFKEYVKRKDRNIPLLSEYAKEFHVEQKVRTYLEVLL